MNETENPAERTDQETNNPDIAREVANAREALRHVESWLEVERRRSLLPQVRALTSRLGDAERSRDVGLARTVRRELRGLLVEIGEPSDRW